MQEIFRPSVHEFAKVVATTKKMLRAGTFRPCQKKEEKVVKQERMKERKKEGKKEILKERI